MLILAGAALAAGEKIHTIVLKKDKQAENISAPVKSIFRVRIQSNISTGYRWYVVSQNKLTESSGKPAIESEKQGMPGRPEYQIFSFKALKKGSGKIVLQYKRYWEKKEKTARTITVTVKIK